MHTVFALLCFVVVIHWLFFPYPSGLLHWHCGNLTIAPVPAKQPWWIWINTSCEFIMNDCITTTKQSTTKPCVYFLGYTVWVYNVLRRDILYCHNPRMLLKLQNYICVLLVNSLVYVPSMLGKVGGPAYCIILNKEGVKANIYILIQSHNVCSHSWLQCEHIGKWKIFTVISDREKASLSLFLWDVIAYPCYVIGLIQ